MTDNDDKLVRAARSLRTGISPERDLWPEIAASLQVPREARSTRRSPWLAQAAAAVLLVGTSSLVTYVAVRYDAPLAPQPQAQLEQQPVGLNFERAAFGGVDTLASVYSRAGGDVESVLDRELESLSPEAREDVQRNLAVIREAISDIAAALEKEPDNVFLQELLVEAYGNELALMNRVGYMAQRVLARKDI